MVGKRADQHLHVIARNKENLSGSGGRRLSVSDVEAMFNGTPYRDELALWNAVTGKVDRGYVVVSDGWVAVARCHGTNDSQCVDTLVSVTATGDIRAAIQSEEAK